MNRRLKRCTIVFGGVTLKCLEARRQDRPWSSFGNKDMLAIFRGGRNRNRIIQSSDIDSNAVGPSFESQGKFRAAIVAKMDINVLAAAVRRERVNCGIVTGK